MASYLKFDLGPNQLLPTLDWRFMPKPDHYRSSGSATMDRYFLGLTMETNTSPYLMVNGNEMPYPEGVDPEGVWHNICGILLYETDGFGTRTYTGYNLVWQYRCEQWTAQGSTGVVQFRQRLIKIKFDDPLDVTQICQYLTGFGSTLMERREFYFIGIQDSHNDDNWVGAGIGYIGYRVTTGEKFGNRYVTIAISDAGFSEYLHADDTIDTTDDPNAGDPDGPSRPGGGDGNHNRKTESITLPDLPALGALDAGMITLYRLTGPEMTNFTSELWTFWSTVKAFFADPLDFIIGCMIVPFTPNSTRQARPKFGADVWNTAFDVISDQFYSISCGTIDIEKYYGSCFDYDPYHKLEIYIPYVGYRELPVDQVMGKTIELTYHIDCMTGDFVAFVHTPVVGPSGPQLAQIICQFAGTMGVHVPLTRQSFDETVKAGINLLGGAVGMAAGGIAQAAGLEGGDLKANQIASQASAATVSAVNAGKRNVIRSGSIGASSGMLAKQNPFIISTLPRQSLPENYIDLEGYPSNIFGTVGSFSGYLAIETIKLQVSATNTEREMILSMLKGGIFV